MGALGVTPYIDRALEVLELAERGNDPFHRALVIARDGTVAGVRSGLPFSVHPGIEAGDVGGRLMDAVANAARDSSARFLLAEMADDPALGKVFALLREHGFREEARVPDFYREGVALTFLRKDL